jgi:hypothetical protein
MVIILNSLSGKHATRGTGNGVCDRPSREAFILEVQSAQAQFAQVSTAYYNIMIGKFQFT